MRFASPLWRILGSAASWLLFTFCFTLLYLGSAVVMGLGGSCASGGPYVIEVQCPDAVVAVVPLSIFGGLAAVAIAMIFARGFGTPLLSWAWPILFIGLGIAFLVASTMPGGFSFLIVGVLFVIMGAAPLVLEFRASPQRLFLGATNIADVRFVEGDRARRSLMQLGRWGVRDSDDPVPPTLGDWSLAIGLWIVTAGLGIFFANTLFAALSAG